MLHPSGAKNDVSITSKSRRPRLQQEASIRIGQEAKKEDQQVEAVLAQPCHAIRMAHSAVLHDQLLALTISDTLVDENTSSGFPGGSTVLVQVSYKHANREPSTPLAVGLGSPTSF